MVKKTALIRYIEKSMHMKSFTGHASEWKSYCLSEIFRSLDYSVHMINWKDTNFTPHQIYDAVLDIRYLNKLTDAFHDDTVKFLFLTSSDDGYMNRAEKKRIDEVNRRRGCHLRARRNIHNLESKYKSIEIADMVNLVGNEHTLHTYPKRYWDKIQLSNTVATYIGKDMMSDLLFRYTGFDFRTMPNYKGHGTKWTYKYLKDLFESMGYNLTLLPWQDKSYTPKQIYDVVFSIINFLNCEEGMDEHTKSLLRLSMTDSDYHNQVVSQRTQEVNSKRGSHLTPNRILPPAEHTYRAFEMADRVFMNGNEVIRDTFPKQYHDKLEMTNVPASHVGKVKRDRPIPAEREFMWHFGSGTIHKGLDLVLEVFKRHPELTLHIVGKVDRDFGVEFAQELGLPNVKYHGWMLVSGSSFRRILDKTFSFIAPSCSEGQSPAVATCLQLGLYPILSKQTGITLPEGCGIYLDELTADDVERAVLQTMDTSDDVLLDQIAHTQPKALVEHSRAAYKVTMEKRIREALSK
jgi:hypothetical protein